MLLPLERFQQLEGTAFGELPASARVPCLLQAGDSLGDGSSVLDFMSVKSYSDVSLDISMLGSLGRLCQAPLVACS